MCALTKLIMLLTRKVLTKKENLKLSNLSFLEESSNLELLILKILSIFLLFLTIFSFS